MAPEYIDVYKRQAFALAYFRSPGLPAMLANIPLEYFAKALEWMASRPDIDATHIAVLGTSRGGELALQLGSMFPSIHAVVAFVPANIRVGACCGESVQGQAAWTYGGRPLAFGSARRGASLDMKAQISVENTNGPILLISGKDDGIWDSTDMTDAVEARLKQLHFRFPVQHLSYANAGHRAGYETFIPT